MSAERRVEDGSECRGRRRVPLAILAVSAGLMLVTRAAVGDDFYLRSGIGLEKARRESGAGPRLPTYARKSANVSTQCLRLRSASALSVSSVSGCAT